MIPRRHEKVTYINDKGEGVELSYSFPYFFTSITGTDGLDTNIYKINSPGQDGSTITNVTLGDRALEINGGIRGYSKTEIARYREELLRVFSPKSKGKIVYEYGDVKKAVECQVEVAPRFKKLSDDYRMQEFKIDLLCPNPYWQDISTIKEEIAIWRGAFEFPLELFEEGIEIGFREPSLIANVYNAGDVPCGMKIQFKAIATVVNPSLLNVNTGEYFKLNKTMQSGETITVTTHFQNKKIEVNQGGNISNGFIYLDVNSTFLQLEPGDNVLRYNADEGIENLEITIWYTPQYLGV